MPRLFPISRKILIKKIKKLEFNGPFSGSKHEYFMKNHHKIFIPNPHNKKDIDIPIIKAIIKQLDISRDEFLNL